MKYDIAYGAYVTQLIASEEHMASAELALREWAEQQGYSLIVDGDEWVIQ